MAPVRSLTTLCLPGGLLILAGLILFRPGILPDAVQPYVQAYPYAVFGVGVVMGWYFNRSRIVFALVVLAMAGVALPRVGGDHAAVEGTSRALFLAVAALLPLNLAAFAMLKERGLFTTSGVSRLAAIATQVLAVDLTIRWEWNTPHEWLAYPLVDDWLTAWTSLPQVSLAAFGLAAVLLVARCVLRRDPIDTGFLWALVSALAALQGIRWGWAPSLLLATGGLTLIWALLETTYRMAYYDELTGLPGRRALNEALLRVGSRYAVAMVDVDHFKRLNDVFGHDVGDQALRMVAGRLSGITGGGKPFRYGGEEFVVLFARASAAEALPHLEAARRAIADASFILRGPRRPRKKPATPSAPRGPQVTVALTVSIGLAEPDQRKGNASPQQVLRAADKALYRAKGAGRNRLMV
jgi:diguanylate cyclase (GGDEF)-like protein